MYCNRKSSSFAMIAASMLILQVGQTTAVKTIHVKNQKVKGGILSKTSDSVVTTIQSPIVLPIHTLDALSGAVTVPLTTILNTVSSPLHIATMALSFLPAGPVLQAVADDTLHAIANSPQNVRKTLCGGIQGIVHGGFAVVSSPLTLCVQV